MVSGKGRKKEQKGTKKILESVTNSSKNKPWKESVLAVDEPQTNSQDEEGIENAD